MAKKAKRSANKATKRTRKHSPGMKVLKYGAIAVAALVLCGVGYQAVRHFKKDETTDVKTLVAQDYARYALNDTTGLADEEDLSAISTESFYKLEGLKITIEKDALIKYQVNYYDKDYAFLGVETLEKNFSEEDASAAEEIGAVYVKIEIIPLEDEDGVISALEKSGYVKQLTVEVSTAKEETEEKESAEDSSEDKDSAETSSAE